VALGRVFSRDDEFPLNRYDSSMDTQERTLASIREQARKSLQGLCQFCQCAGVLTNAFAGLAYVRVAFLCTSVDSFSTFFSRTSNQGGLPFKSRYSLQDEIFKALE